MKSWRSRRSRSSWSRSSHSERSRSSRPRRSRSTSARSRSTIRRSFSARRFRDNKTNLGVLARDSVHGRYAANHGYAFIREVWYLHFPLNLPHEQVKMAMNRYCAADGQGHNPWVHFQGLQTKLTEHLVSPTFPCKSQHSSHAFVIGICHVFFRILGNNMQVLAELSVKKRDHDKKFCISSNWYSMWARISKLPFNYSNIFCNIVLDGLDAPFIHHF